MNLVDSLASETIDAARKAAQEGNIGQALDLALQATARRRDPEHLEVLGQLLLMAGQPAAAAATLQEAVVGRPHSVATRLALALALQKQQENEPAWRAAVEQYRIATILDPSIGDEYLNTAILRHARGEPDGMVLRYLQRATTLDPQSPYAWGNASSIQFDRGIFAQAAMASRRAACLAPAMPEVVHGLAETMAVIGTADIASIWFDRLVRLDPGSMNFRVSRGKARLSSGDFAGG